MMNDKMRLLLIAILILSGMTLVYKVDVAEETRAYVQPLEPIVLTPEQEGYRAFFKNHGSPAATEMAMAVTKAKPENRPILAAIAVVESNGTPWAVGDGGHSKGSMQVQAKHWGEVPDTAEGQVLQAESILEDLLQDWGRLRCGRRRIRSALASYNGGVEPPRRSWHYAEKVVRLADVATLAKLERNQEILLRSSIHDIAQNNELLAKLHAAEADRLVLAEAVMGVAEWGKKYVNAGYWDNWSKAVSLAETVTQKNA